MTVLVLSQSTVVFCIIGMDEVPLHQGHKFEKSSLNFQFQCEMKFNSMLNVVNGRARHHGQRACVPEADHVVIRPCACPEEPRGKVPLSRQSSSG